MITGLAATRPAVGKSACKARWPGERPLFEYSPADAAYDPATGVCECQLCLPVTPL